MSKLQLQTITKGAPFHNTLDVAFAMEKYLFRIDMAVDNDAYTEAFRDKVVSMYAGIDLRIGLDNWAPDFVEVCTDENSSITVTLIELEARSVTARISSRKYLPEDPQLILKAFLEYLGRVIKNCRSTADPRESTFRILREKIINPKQILIYAAGALRKSTKFIECHPLLYQPKATFKAPEIKQAEQNDDSLISLRDRLSADEVKWFFRTVAILDAVVRGKDKSIATFRAWRTQNKSQPLKYYLKNHKNEYPVLYSFVFSTKKEGTELAMDRILAELVMLWSSHLERSLDIEDVKDLITANSRESRVIKGHDKMQNIFRSARAIVSNSNI
ncbi:MAG TPA: hypothetical protein VFF49_00455 [Thermodesulfobacteriota bacterium]|nr:hypothetical protein [Thermodesulfobacteriota bacterium]